MIGPVLALLACTGGPSVDDTGDSPAPPFVETLDPDQVHVLAACSPAPGAGHALAELSLGLDVRWALDLDDDDGVAGAVRLPDGETVYVRSALPPDFASSLERVTVEGALVWSQDDFFSFSFAHGLEVTPDGDYIIADTVQSRVFAVSEAGDLRWELTFREDGGGRLPNGLDLHTDAEGVTRLVVSELAGALGTDRVEVFRLGAPTEQPVLEWTYEGGSGSADRLWPHGPRFLADGTVIVSYAARGRIAHLVDGLEDWAVPEEPGVLAFPRDTYVLPDGSWLVADAAEEVLRVHDPLGRFEIVDAASVPGVFGFSEVVCGDGGGLPCLGP